MRRLVFDNYQQCPVSLKDFKFSSHFIKMGLQTFDCRSLPQFLTVKHFEKHFSFRSNVFM